MLKQDRYTVDTIERIWFRPFNVILYPDVHIGIGNLNNLWQQKEVIFIDTILYSSGESLGEVSYETYPCQIEKSNASTSLVTLNHQKKGQGDCFSKCFIKAMMTDNVERVWLN